MVEFFMRSGEFTIQPWLIAAIAGAAAVLVVLILLLARRSKKKKKTRSVAAPEPSAERIVTKAPLETETGPDQTVKRMELSDASPVAGVSFHGIGRRRSQQDSFGFSESGEDDPRQRFFAVVADGMGGLSDGDRVSQMVVLSMLQGFDSSDPESDPADILLSLTEEAADIVNEDLGPERIAQCGSTVVAVCIVDGTLHFVSVGDSHIYLWRENVLHQLNRDHNYAAILDEKVRLGEISEEEALYDPQRAALTSYIGMGELDEIDQEEEPIELLKGDRILLMSDGVFGTVSLPEINGILSTQTLEGSGEALEYAVRAAGKRDQDNYTCILLEVK